MKLKEFLGALNVAERCRVYRVGLWQCPHFLFIVMGFIIILAILATHLVASVYSEPEVSLSIVFAVTIVLFIISHAVVNAFDKVATASQLKSEFIGILSHELRNPLSAVKWQINSLTAEKLLDGEEKLRKGLAIIGGENERMIKLVNDLLDVNRIEDGTLVIAPAVFSLRELTERVATDYSPYARASNLALNIFASKSDFKVRADEERIKSVIARFIDNAIRYSVSAGEISISLEDLGGKVRWSVKDQGAGIPAPEVDRVFSKFFRATNILRYQTGGLGVGLYLAKYAVEASGGEIGFRTLEGHGSTFFFTLPKA
ncbi:MAG: HAMP domain-containing sensor histidine kinase [bacterium]|nr:HAMP domain-containing sensor histidine kinase [bacterium]